MTRRRRRLPDFIRAGLNHADRKSDSHKIRWSSFKAGPVRPERVARRVRETQRRMERGRYDY